MTDHFALVALTKKELGDLPLKLRDLFLELRGFNYTTEYLAGARNIISDSLSRAVRWAAKDSKDKDKGEEEDINTQFQQEEGIERVFARQVTATDNREAFMWKDHIMQQVIEEAGRDKEYMEVASLVKQKKDSVYVKNKLPSSHPAR